MGDFFKGLPVDAADLGKTIATVVADVAGIKQDLATGNYTQTIADLKSDLATVKAELAQLKTDVANSLKPPATTAAPAPTEKPIA